MCNNNYDITKSVSTELGRFTIILDTVDKDGKTHPYSYVQMSKCVCILPIIKNQVLLIKQYRHALKDWLWEIPGGGIEEGENIIESARRELLEETGCEIIKLIDLGYCFPSPGATTEICYLYAAECSKLKDARLEPLEFISSKLFTFEEINQLIDSNRLAHSAGVIAWYKYRERKEL